MLDEDKLKQVVADVLDVDVATIGADFSMDTVEQWDSLRHMTLVLAIEDAFSISIPDDEAANITSWPLIKVVVEEQLHEA
ncbi:acyl carrier protein [Sphingomonas sp. JC676]|uniref:phosphopantetheine-binding protein n=1 Tax=Sphingomonas sp. JC676 TaxID=2768065 RepID=UPI0016586F6A|nr:phosphopantetheine-binding protein [Sphingomonas sp. JC676]MBC9030946.1 acyl carrier protein [Sphingomonas sp. JC676]